MKSMNDSAIALMEAAVAKLEAGEVNQSILHAQRAAAEHRRWIGLLAQLQSLGVDKLMWPPDAQRDGYQKVVVVEQDLAARTDEVDAIYFDLRHMRFSHEARALRHAQMALKALRTPTPKRDFRETRGPAKA